MPYTKEQDLLIKVSRLSDEHVPEIKDVDLDTLFKLADQNGILPYIFDKLGRNGVRHRDLLKYKGLARTKRLTAAAKQMEFDLLSKKLDERQIPFIPLKGIILSRMLYPAEELREMQDIDILARYEDSERLNELLKELNYSQNYADRSIRRDILPLLHDKKLKEHIDCVEFRRAQLDLEVHFKILPSKISSIPNEELWKNSAEEEIKGIRFRLLCPELQVLNIATHSFRHNMAYGIRPLAEIDALIGYYGKRFDFSKFEDIALRYDLAQLSYVPIHVVKEFYGSVPKEVIERIGRSSSKTILRLAHRLSKDFFNRHGIPELDDQTFYLHILRQKNGLRKLARIFFPPIPFLRLKGTEGEKKFRFIYFQYPLRFLKLLKTYLPGIVRSAAYRFKLYHGRNSQP